PRRHPGSAPAGWRRHLLRSAGWSPRRVRRCRKALRQAGLLPPTCPGCPPGLPWGAGVLHFPPSPRLRPPRRRLTAAGVTVGEGANAKPGRTKELSVLCDVGARPVMNKQVAFASKRAGLCVAEQLDRTFVAGPVMCTR